MNLAIIKKALEEANKLIYNELQLECDDEHAEYYSETIAHVEQALEEVKKLEGSEINVDPSQPMTEKQVIEWRVGVLAALAQTFDAVNVINIWLEDHKGRIETLEGKKEK